MKIPRTSILILTGHREAWAIPRTATLEAGRQDLETVGEGNAEYEGLPVHVMLSTIIVPGSGTVKNNFRLGV